MAAGAGTPPVPARSKDVGKYIFFDFENGWQQLVRDDFELDLSQIENELLVQPVGLVPQSAPAQQPPATAASAAGPSSTPLAQ